MKKIWIGIFIPVLFFCFSSFRTNEKGNITKLELLTNYHVYAKLDNFVFEGINYTVTNFSYTFLYGTHNEKMETEKVQGNALPSRLRALIKDCHSGNKLIIHDVIAVGPTTPALIMDGPVFTIE